MQPIQKENEIPQRMARNTASIDAQTEVAPFTPQNQGVISGSFFEASFIPSGKAVPMKKPMGVSSNPATRIRIAFEEDSNCRMMGTVARPNAETVRINNRKHKSPFFPKSEEEKLAVQ